MCVTTIHSLVVIYGTRERYGIHVVADRTY
jgi:hypothetical protein